MTAVDGNVVPPSSTTTSSGIYISAPGKIILFGEHAVVYGRTAVAGSIDLRTFVSLFTSQDGRLYLSLPDLGVEKTWMLKDLIKAAEKLNDTCVEDGTPPSLELIVPIARKLSGSCEEQCGVQHLAILAFWYLLLAVAQRKRNILAVKVTVRFRLPSCVGLGSSGAYCVCITAALLQAVGLIPRPTVPVTGTIDGMTWDESSLEMIRKWAASAEALIHGRASGIDAAVCTYGGVASFKPGERIKHFKNLPDLRVILVNSKVERNTSRMVAMVKERLKKYPDVVEGIFNAIDAISKESAKILNRPAELGGEQNQDRSSSASSSTVCTEDEHHSLQTANATVPPTSPQGDLYARLNDLCRINNQLLIALGVGHPKIDQISTLLARYGVHPKMTGAGGGGSVYAFLKPDTSATVMEMITAELTKLGYEVWRPPLGGDGLLMHSRKPDLFNTPVKAGSNKKL